MGKWNSKTKEWYCNVQSLTPIRFHTKSKHLNSYHVCLSTFILPNLQRRIIFKWINKYNGFIYKATWNDQEINFDEEVQGSRIHRCFGGHASIVSKTFNFLGKLLCHVQWLFTYTLKRGSQHSMSKVAISPTNNHKNIHNKWHLTTDSCHLYWLWQSRPSHNQIKLHCCSHLGCGNFDWWNNIFYKSQLYIQK